MRNGVADHRDSLTVVFRRDQLRGMHAENGGEHAVIRARRAAALHMARHDCARFHADHLFKLFGNAVGNAVEAGFLAESGALFFLHRRFLDAHRALGHGDDGEILAVFGAGCAPRRPPR